MENTSNGLSDREVPHMGKSLDRSYLIRAELYKHSDWWPSKVLPRGRHRFTIRETVPWKIHHIGLRQEINTYKAPSLKYTG